MELDKKVFDSKGQEHSVRIVPASICAMRKLNDPRSLEGDRKGTKSEGVGARKANV